jgi:hypothetical protein
MLHWLLEIEGIARRMGIHKRAKRRRASAGAGLLMEVHDSAINLIPRDLEEEFSHLVKKAGCGLVAGLLRLHQRGSPHEGRREGVRSVSPKLGDSAPNGDVPEKPRGRPTREMQVARQQAMRLRRSILDEAAFGGGFDVPEDITPTEAAVEAFRRSLGMVRWIESQMAQWAPSLLPLTENHYDDKNALQVMPSHEAAWLELWMQERKELRESIKLCHAIGVEERQMALQEQQADAMFMILERVMDSLGLSDDQRAKIPQLMPEIIRTVAMPGSGRTVHTPQL